MRSILRFSLALLVLVANFSVRAADAPPEVPLWPNGAPGEHGDIGPEHDTTKPNEGTVAGKYVIRLGNVTKPTLAVYRPAAGKDTGCAVVVCPGGGYNILAMDLEGTEVCEWLNSIGVTAVLLKYRVPARKGGERYAAPLQDAQRALGVARQHAAEWKIDPKRLGILGFSAGGHLSATAANNFEKRTYEAMDDADAVSCRPDFTILIYPAYLTPEKNRTKLSPEINVTANTPPAFIVQTQDDGVGVENSLVYATALQAAGVPVELHIFPRGGHGYGLRPSENPVSNWPKLAGEWLRTQGWLSPASGK